MIPLLPTKLTAVNGDLMFDRIGIGTANWGKKYRGHQVSKDEIQKILDYAQSSGITFIDSAVAYENEEAMKMVNSSFDVQCKVLDDQRPDWATSFISHDEKYRGEGRSFYDPQPLTMLSHKLKVQVPYSILNRGWRFSPFFTYQARSVFCGGNVFEHRPLIEYSKKIGIPIGTICIQFCLMNPNIDKVIIGVDSVAQLKEDLRYFHRLNSFECTDPDIIDTRRH